MPRKNKIFILDTNVILHDSSCIHQFEQNDIVIPIAVLEELDNFKIGSQVINYHARRFVRELDRLSSDKMFNGGVQVGEGKGRVSIRLDKDVHLDLEKIFPNVEKEDHRILNIAYHVAQENTGHRVTLVSKDVNLRMKARSVGLQAEDYTTDYVRDPSHLYSGCRYEDNVADEVIDKLYKDEGVLAQADFTPEVPLQPNEFIVLRSGKKSALACFEHNNVSLGCVVKRVNKRNVYGITPRNAEQTFAVAALVNPAVQLVTVSGKAGTGKTLLALATALEMRSKYRQILLARPIMPLSNKDIGYLPGDIASKVKPYMQPLYDNLGVIRGQFSENSENNKRLQKMLDDEKLAIEPLAYIRGRSLVKMYMIIDEAQNLTPHEVKTIITRAGEGTKIVFTGDINQIDHPYLSLRSNGLTNLIDKMQGQEIYAHIDLKKGERSELAELASNVL